LQILLFRLFVQVVPVRCALFISWIVEFLVPTASSHPSSGPGVEGVGRLVLFTGVVVELPISDAVSASAVGRPSVARFPILDASVIWANCTLICAMVWTREALFAVSVFHGTIGKFFPAGAGFGVGIVYLSVPAVGYRPLASPGIPGVVFRPYGDAGKVAELEGFVAIATRAVVDCQVTGTPYGWSFVANGPLAVIFA